jgi:hypothetical protein
MISLKILSTAAAIALVLPALVPTESFAQVPHRGGVGRPGVGVRPGGGPRFNGGGYRGGYHGGYHGGGGGAGALIGAGIAGAVIGGAIASGGGYGPGYYAPGPGYYGDPGYDDGGAVAVAPGPGGGDDAVAYCMQTYRSYDPQSGTYMGNDGYRHPCP